MIRFLIPVILLIPLCGCNQDMISQPKDNEYKPAELFPNNRILQRPPLGSVARGDAARTKQAAEKPIPTLALLERGQHEFDVFCSPCHGRLGDGRGMIVARGFPAPPTYHQERLRAASDQHFYDVISNGYGVMYSYADRVMPADRWAIVAYIRALQLSENASLDDAPPAERGKLVTEAQP
ncbi:MAG TPA: cytochrome c [Micropepsaceae bacterium]